MFRYVLVHNYCLLVFSLPCYTTLFFSSGDLYHTILVYCLRLVLVHSHIHAVRYVFIVGSTYVCVIDRPLSFLLAMNAVFNQCLHAVVYLYLLLDIVQIASLHCL